MKIRMNSLGLFNFNVERETHALKKFRSFAFVLISPLRYLRLKVEQVDPFHTEFFVTY